ncbi:peptide deformylase [candidate division KSB1 bacterium]
MAVRPVLIYGDPRLHDVASPVEKIDKNILNLIDDMFETMFEGKGIGLAATQIGEKKNIIVVDLGKDEPESSMIVLINPEIIKTEGMCSYDEGCLSVPGVNAELERPENITVKFMDKDGETKDMEASGLLARVIQHEFDHLNGILFVQKLSSSVRKKLAHQLRNLADGIVA